ncbi:MAG: Calx-beta domain-containing protein [Candidatus Marithrix sp.]
MKKLIFIILVVFTIPSFADFQFSENNYRVNESTSKLTLFVKHTNFTGKTTINYFTKSGSAKAGSDFKIAKGSLTWTDSSDKTFTIEIIDDFIVENNETFVITLLDKTGTLDRAKITIVDNDSNKMEAILLPTTGNINLVQNYNGQIINDATINGSISNTIFTGNIINNGLISNSTITEDATLQGGKLSGYIINQGKIIDIEFVGAKITGGTLAGTILIEKHITDLGLGVLKNVTLAKNTIIIGGILEGIITGDPEGEACIEQVTISPNAELQNIVIKDNCQVKLP